MNSSNVPFCNLYNRKCDFSPLRAAWRPDFFVMGLCSPFALRYAGQLQAGAQDSWCLLPRAALRDCLPVQCWRFCASACLLACHAAALVCAVPGRRSGVSVRLLVWPRNFGRRSATATVRRRIWLAPWAKLSMRTISIDLIGHWRPGMVRRTRRGDGTAQWLPYRQSRPDGLCHVFSRAARQRAALRLAAAIVHVAHDCIANP